MRRFADPDMWAARNSHPPVPSVEAIPTSAITISPGGTNYADSTSVVYGTGPNSAPIPLSPAHRGAVVAAGRP